jgi:hypothetical protein
VVLPCRQIATAAIKANAATPITEKMINRRDP